jgi:parallel beta-helix repeat protein
MRWSKCILVLLAFGLGFIIASSSNGSAADQDGSEPLIREVGPVYSPDTPLDGIYGEVLAKAEANWTVIVYLDGDNNLGTYMLTDLASLTSAGSNANVNVLVLFDKLGRDNTEAYYLFGGSRQSIPLSAISSTWTDEVNMGDPNTLVKFSSYCISNYPAQHYLVILQDHGAAWAGCCWDDNSNGDRLTISELDSAFSAIKGRIGHNVDVVLFNDCLMSNIDVLYQLYPYTDYIVGSETLGWTSNYDNEYAGIINWMKSVPSPTPQQVAVYLVDAITLVDNEGYVTQSVAAVNMSQVAHLGTDMDELSGHLIDYLDIDGRGVIEARGASPFMIGPYSGDKDQLIDLANFLENLVVQNIDDSTRACALDIMAEIGMNGGSPNSVIIKERETTHALFTNGISLYYPVDRASFSSDYLVGNDFTSDTRWDEFLNIYYSYSPHSPPIRVEGDAQLATQAIMYGWSGSGTSAHPYLINDLTIKTNGTGNCIFLANLTKYLVISDSFLSCGQDGPTYADMDGVMIINCDNVVIERCTIEKSRYGIGLIQSQGSYIRFNQISSCFSGINLSDSPQNAIMDNSISGSVSFEIDMEGSSNNQIIGNHLSSTSGLGIQMASSNYNTFIGNQLINCCFFPSGGLLTFSSQTIEVSNTVNGLPVRYYKNVDLGDATIQLGAGQIILGNVVNARVAGQSMNGTGYPIMMVGCSHITIERNELSNATIGIFALGSHNSTIRWNNIDRCSEYGTYLQSSNDWLVASNILSRCTNEGIYLWQSIDSTLVLNELIGNHDSGSVFDPDHAQAYDQTGQNQWNDYIKGNYWSDWTEPDLNSDNIVDIPYSIPSEAICWDGRPLSIPPSLDITAPTVELNAPSEGQIFTIDQVQLEWTVTDPGTGMGELWVRAGPSSSWTNVTGTTSHLFIGLSEGPHVLQLRASDYVGNEIVVSRQFFVDQYAPSISWTAPNNGSYVRSTSPIISWTGVDQGSAIAGYQVSIDGGPWSTVNNYPFIRLYDLSQGPHQLSLNASDKGGHWRIFSISFIVDSILPSIFLDSPLIEQMVESSSIQACWYGSDDGSGISRFEARMDQQGWVDLGTDLQAIFDFKNDGPHTLFLRAIDGAGNINSTSISFIIETSPPQIEISAPSDGAFLSTSSIELVWVGSDAGAGIDHYEIKVDDNDWVEVGMAGSWRIIGLADGEHTLSVKAVDRTGKENVSEEKIMIDTLAPDLLIISPLNGTLHDSFNVELAWSCQDQGNGWAIISIQVDTGAWTDLGVVDHVDITLSEGQHLITLRATDRAGNTDEETIDIIIDTIAPSVIGRGPDGPYEPLQQRIWFILSEDANSSSVHLWVNGVDVNVDRNGTYWGASEILLSNRTYLLEVEAKDVAGNVMPRYSWTFSTTALVTVSGIVLDQEGKPIVGAKVSIGPVVGTTDSNGSFDLQVLAGPSHLIITAPGQQDTEMDLNVSNETQIGTVGMVKRSGLDLILVIMIGVALSIIIVSSVLWTNRKR